MGKGRGMIGKDCLGRKGEEEKDEESIGRREEYWERKMGKKGENWRRREEEDWEEEMNRIGKKEDKERI